MAYLVLARKYRPSRFKDIVGQEHVVRTLQNALRIGRLHHAFVLTGARGVGKTTIARILARAFNCLSPESEDIPCGVCSSCVQSLEGKHPDVIEIDGASHTGVDHIRNIRENIAYLPALGRRKIYIIDEVHMLSQAAFNALLKTLEEPPAHVCFIFATTEPHKIPTTVLSRCQRFDLRRLPHAALVGHLSSVLQQEQVVLPSVSVHAVAHMAQGSVRDALSLLDQVLSYAGEHPSEQDVQQALGLMDRTWAYTAAEHLLNRAIDPLLTTLQEAENKGYDLSECAASLCEHLRHLAVCKMASEPHAVLPECSTDEIARFMQQAQLASVSDIHRVFAACVRVADDVSRSNHPRMTFEMGLLRMLDIAPTADLSTLLTRLDALVHTQQEAGASHTPNPAAAPARAPAKPSPTAKDTPPTVFVHHDAWLQYVDKVRKTRPALASVLEHGRVMVFSPQHVQIAYASGTFYHDAACDAENKELFTALLKEHMGQPCRFEVITSTGASAQETAAPTLAERKKDDAAKAEANMRAHALEHPAVRNAVAILGAKVQEIRPEHTFSTEHLDGSE